VQTNNPQYISATFYSLGIYFSWASSHHCSLRIATYGPTQWIWKRESQYIPTKISLTITSSPKKLEQKRYLLRNKKCYTSPAWIISTGYHMHVVETASSLLGGQGFRVHILGQRRNNY
jgi:hypothetical protein